MDDIHGYELWTSDGTTAGTVLLKDIDATEGIYPQELTAVGNTLFFLARGSLRWLRVVEK